MPASGSTTSTVQDAKAWDAEWDEVTMRGLKAKLGIDAQFKSILTELKRRKVRLLHFERGGARSFWGGSVDKDTGAVKGTNRLGQLMHELMDTMAGDDTNEVAVEPSVLLNGPRV